MALKQTVFYFFNKIRFQKFLQTYLLDVWGSNTYKRKKYEVNCHDKAQLFSLNSQLENEGVQLFYIDGDVATNSICAVAHGVALGKLAKKTLHFWQFM